MKIEKSIYKRNDGDYFVEKGEGYDQKNPY